MRFGDKVWRGYERNQLQEVCRRYVSMADLERLKQDVGEPEDEKTSNVKAEPRPGIKTSGNPQAQRINSEGVLEGQSLSE